MDELLKQYKNEALEAIALEKEFNSKAKALERLGTRYIQNFRKQISGVDRDDVDLGPANEQEVRDLWGRMVAINRELLGLQIDNK